MNAMTSAIYNLAYFVDQGLVKAPFFIQFIFGVMGGIGPDLDNLMFMKRTADRLFGAESYHWSVLAAGKYQMPFITQAALMGGNVRVGLEDSLFIEPGRLAASNRSEEHTSELQSLMRISYAVFCLKKKKEPIPK